MPSWRRSPEEARPCWVLRLAGPAPDGTEVTYGGAALDDYGGWTTTAKEPVQLSGAEFVVEVPAAGAASVVLTPA